MTTITLNLSPELEQKLLNEAAKEGIEPDCYIVNALQEHLQSQHMLEKKTESDLLEQINIGFSAETWAKYHNLIAKRHAETLSPEEHEDLIQLSDRLEKLNVTRIQALIQLANLREQPLSDLMQNLGIRPNPEVLDYV
jgi:thymidylate kinase